MTRTANSKKNNSAPNGERKMDLEKIEAAFAKIEASLGQVGQERGRIQ